MTVPLLPEEVKLFTKLGGGLPYLNIVRACFSKKIKNHGKCKIFALQKILILFIDEKEYLVSTILIINFPHNYSF